MANPTEEQLLEKIAQAYQVIGQLLDKTGDFGSVEGQRALDYFAGDEFDEDFLPWPRHDDEGLRPEELNAANDD